MIEEYEKNRKGVKKEWKELMCDGKEQTKINILSPQDQSKASKHVPTDSHLKQRFLSDYQNKSQKRNNYVYEKIVYDSDTIERMRVC